MLACVCCGAALFVLLDHPIKPASSSGKLIALHCESTSIGIDADGKRLIRCDVPTTSTAVYPDDVVHVDRVSDWTLMVWLELEETGRVGEFLAHVIEETGLVDRRQDSFDMSPTQPFPWRQEGAGL